MFLAVPWNLEYLRRPPKVELTDSGITMHQRYGRKPMFVPWSGVVKLNIAMVGERERNWNTMDSYLFITEKNYYVLHWRVGTAIREEYKARFGSYPRNVSAEYDRKIASRR